MKFKPVFGIEIGGIPQRRTTDINVGPPMNDFMRGVQKTLVKQPDFRGIGGHGPEDHGSHGLHSQTSIGMNNATINFRHSVPNGVDFTPQAQKFYCGDGGPKKPTY